MQVYKAFYKIILKNFAQILIYIIVFLSIAISASKMNIQKGDSIFQETKVNIAFINNDKYSEFIKGLEGYLDQNCNIIKLPEDKESLQDALFYREVEYIIKVPKGFTETFLSGKDITLDTTAVPGSSSEVYINNMVNKYLNTARAYINASPNLTIEKLLSYIDKDLSEKTEVKLNNFIEEVDKNQKVGFYYNYMAYSILGVLILGICSVMLVFNNRNLKMRNLCTPVKIRNINFQLILGSLSYTVLFWFIMISTSFFMYGSYMFTAKGLLLLLNSFVFSLAVLSIGFLIGNIVKSKNTLSVASNVITLGTCFISGVFVDQSLLSKSVLRIASFTPNYWYVKANNSIVSLSNYSFENLRSVFFNMLIVISFAVAILCVALVIIKQRRLND
ncbi:ABC-2 family transporter protein [Clostridium sp. N3C]|uniref:ABC transporter permease n=1 Tax=Clostridium sp. N3C TaxID=1776758 RepID=UPI00092E1E39|nr:ABC transporter permease [Clostridium sp. N3C]SCN22070.1 ABC-2 family transporter protein [Clostridium sp. N3C]